MREKERTRMGYEMSQRNDQERRASARKVNAIEETKQQQGGDVMMGAG